MATAYLFRVYVNGELVRVEVCGDPSPTSIEQEETFEVVAMESDPDYRNAKDALLLRVEEGDLAHVVVGLARVDHRFERYWIPLEEA